MSAPHTAPVEGSFDPLDRDAGQVRVVRDEDAPSRKTLFLDAPGMSLDERSAYWLSADASDFRTLSEMR